MGHISRECRSSARCQKCHKKHHTSICDSSFSQNQQENSPSSTGSGQNPRMSSSQPTQPTSALVSHNQQVVFLQTACAVIHLPGVLNTCLRIRLVLDGGSQRSYLSKRARNALKLQPTRSQSLSIATFGSNRSNTKVCPVVEVGLQLRGYPSMMLSVYVVPTICEPLASQPVAACVKQYPHLRGLELADCSSTDPSMPIDMLIGSDYYWELVTGSICRGANGPTAIHTKLGWVLSGPSSHDVRSNCAVNLTVTHVLHTGTTEPLQELNEQLRAFWELEALGIQGEESTLHNQFEKVVRFVNERYQVPLPWKEYHNPLPDNYQLCVTRLKGLLHQLRQDPAILKEYDGIIRDQLEKGIIEAVSTDEQLSGTLHYLPHHAVVRQDKSTTKVRIVYDALAKSASNNPSLNECLHKGPKFNQLIFDLLVQFRSYEVALTADLEKAFLMVAVDEADRDALRYIWVDEARKEQPNLKIYRFARVVFGVSASPFLLNATIRFHLERNLNTNKTVVNRLLHSTYVDDIVSGANTKEEAFNLYAVAKAIFLKGGFNLRKFLTNSKNLQRQINQQEKLK